MALFALVFLAGAGAQAAAQTFSFDAQNGSLSGAFPSFTIVGPNTYSSVPDQTSTYSGTFATETTVSFTWSYWTNDSSGYDFSGYILNGTPVALTSGATSGSGSVTVTVPAGGTLGWYVRASDSCCGPGVLAVSVPASILSTALAIPSGTVTQDVAAPAFTPVTASGGMGTKTFSVSPALPAGLSLNTSTGAITGTATVSAPAANYTVTVTDQAPGPQTSSQTFSLTVQPSGTLVISPTTPVTISGPQGGPFTPASFDTTTTNSGHTAINISTTGAPSWLSFTNVHVGAFAQSWGNTTAVVNSSTNALSPGTYSATLTFANATNGQGGGTRDIILNVLRPAQLEVTDTDGLVASGTLGGPFSPTSKTYTLTNTGEVPVDFTATDDRGWIDVSPAAGTIPAGGSTTVTVSHNSAANSLAVGSHTGTLTFTNTTNGVGNTTRSVALDVLAPATLNVTPADGLVASGVVGGPFSPSSKAYTLTNTGAVPLNFTAADGLAWTDVSPASGTIAAGGTATVTVALNSGANALAAGSHTGTLTITNTTNGLGSTTRSIALSTLRPAELTVTPADGLVASGNEGGPFSPSSKAYVLSNSGEVDLDFTAGTDTGWLTASPASGTIAPGGSTSVTLSINGTSGSLPAGTHGGTLTLTNTTSGLGSTTRSAGLTIIPNGHVILKVVMTEGDGSFAFTSATPALAMTLTSSGGTAQSAAVPLVPGTYAVNVSPPDGFALTAISCSDADSAGNVSARSASIVLSPAEVVTCTFSAADTRKKTVEVISRFMQRRNDLLVSSGPDAGRQVDRLIEAGGASAGSPAGFAGGGGSPSRGLAAGPSRLGSNDTSLSSGFASSRGIGSRRSHEDRLADLGIGMRDASDGAGGRPGAAPFGVMGNEYGPVRFSFSTSLSQMMRFQDDATARKLREAQQGSETGGPMSVGAGPLPTMKRQFSPFDIWAEGQYQSFTDNRDKADADGHFGVFYVGADYVVNRNLLIGALVQYDTMQQRSTRQDFDIKGDGWMAGPYATLRLSQNVFLQSRVAIGRSDNEVSPFLSLGYVDRFSTKRWLTTSTLVGRWQHGNWQIRPSATVSYIEDASEAYIDSLGVAIPGIKVSLGQFKAGPQFSYRYAAGNGILLEPRLGAELIWNFDSSTKIADFGGTLSGPEEVRGRVELGIRAQFADGTSVDLSGSFDGIGSGDFSSIGGKATLRVPLN